MFKLNLSVNNIDIMDFSPANALVDNVRPLIDLGIGVLFACYLADIFRFWQKKCIDYNHFVGKNQVGFFISPVRSARLSPGFLHVAKKLIHDIWE